MSQQPHQQQPAWGPQPPQQPPGKAARGKKIAGIGCLSVIGLFVLVIIISVATDGDSDKDTNEAKSKATAAAPAEEKPAAADESSQAPTVSAEDKAKIREDAGYPPKPDAATAAAYIRALDAVDTDIVHGKEEKALSRGAETCRSIKEGNNRNKLIELTNYRFSSPDHPDGHGTATAGKILDIAHSRLCPDF